MRRRRSDSTPTPTSIRRRQCSPAANFAGASTQNLTDARRLYGLLTGRVSAINGTSRLSEATNQYEYLGPRTERVRLNELGLFAQDSWRFTPTLTVNYGLRWELQLPMQPLNDSFSMSTLADLCGRSGVGSGPGGRGCNFFQPGTLTGITPQYVQYDSGNPGYETDWNNFAPNVGAAWRPNVQDGWLRALLGDPDQATIRADYSVAFTRERMDRFTGLYSANPGAAINANRTGNQGNLVLAGESWPITLSQQNRLGPPAFPTSPSYPLTPSLVNGDDINIFDPLIKVPNTRSWSIGLQRAISNDMAIDVRYVGTRLMNGWTTENWNEINIVENRFLDEFKLAQANLRAHVAAGCGTGGGPACSFAYRGAGTGTSPLPTYLAYFARIPASRADDVSAYSGVTQFTNSAWTGHLGEYEPDPIDAGNDLHANATLRANALAAGLPANFFVLNPDVDQANITRDAAQTKYDALQIDFRRRSVARPQCLGQLHLREDVRNRPRHGPSRSRPDPGRRRRAARVQDDVVLRVARGPREAFRLGHQPVAERPPRQLGVLGHRPVPSPRLPHRRRLAPRRHVGR